MKFKIACYSAVLYIAVIILTTAICIAQPGTQTPLPDNGGSWPSDNGGQQSDNGADFPISAQPAYVPSESSGDTAEANLPEGEVTYQQIQSADPSVARLAMVTNFQQWVLYNRAWSVGPAAVNYYRQISAILWNDQNQYITSYEKYPDGTIRRHDVGYHSANTYVHGRFIGDVPGWHQLVMKGSLSSWSNIIWVYVYPSGGSGGGQCITPCGMGCCGAGQVCSTTTGRCVTVTPGGGGGYPRTNEYWDTSLESCPAGSVTARCGSPNSCVGCDGRCTDDSNPHWSTSARQYVRCTQGKWEPASGVVTTNYPGPDVEPPQPAYPDVPQPAYPMSNSSIPVHVGEL